LAKRLIKYTIVWISQNLAIPFWVVGHVHLSVNVYEDIYEIFFDYFDLYGYRKSSSPLPEG
jgi:hypothetical protein